MRKLLLFLLIPATFAVAQTDGDDALEPYRAGDYERAIRITTRELEANPNNIESHIFRNKVLERYRGNAPIYDMGDILSTHADGTKATFTVGEDVYRMMCPEFNINGDNTHPNAAFSEERMAKGMLVLLYKMFVEQVGTPGDADGDGDVDLDDFNILKGNFGMTAGATTAQGDFDGDGDVDLDDFNILKGNFGA